MNDKRKEFLEALIEIADYWKDKRNGSFGAIFSTLVMFDGCSGMNDFKRVEINGITNDKELHEDFCDLRRERNGKEI